MAITHTATRGTGVAGSGNNNPVTATPSATIAAGSALFVYISWKATGVVNSVTDSGGNIYRRLGTFKNVTNGNVGVEVWFSLTTVQLTTGSTVTVTFDSNQSDVCVALDQWAVAAGKALRQIAGVAVPTSEVNGANGFGSSSYSSQPSLSRAWLRVCAKQANSTTGITASTNFTSSGYTVRSRNNAAATILRVEFRINTSTGETSNPTLAVSGNTAGLFFAFEEVTPKTPMAVLRFGMDG